MSNQDMHLFGRLRPDRHVQRVETPDANHLFLALDHRLQSRSMLIEQLFAAFDTEGRVSRGVGRIGVVRVVGGC